MRSEEACNLKVKSLQSQRSRLKVPIAVLIIPCKQTVPRLTSSVHTNILTSACLSISCVYCGRSPKSSIMVAMVIVSVTDTPVVSSRCCKICSVRAGLMFTMAGLTHTLTSCEGSDWLKMSMTSSAVCCRRNTCYLIFCTIFIESKQSSR